MNRCLRWWFSWFNDETFHSHHDHHRSHLSRRSSSFWFGIQFKFFYCSFYIRANMPATCLRVVNFIKEPWLIPLILYVNSTKYNIITVKRFQVHIFPLLLYPLSLPFRQLSPSRSTSWTLSFFVHCPAHRCGAFGRFFPPISLVIFPWACCWSLQSPVVVHCFRIVLVILRTVPPLLLGLICVLCKLLSIY